MVLRPSSSSWSISPETIMSHHYRLSRGVKAVIDTSPPFSMHNSPISVHYIPKRSSSADTTRKRQFRTSSRPHRELAEFVNGGRFLDLHLPLPLRNSTNDLVKPKILNSRNYQPPLYKKHDNKKPILPPSVPIRRDTSNVARERRKISSVGRRATNLKNLFKDAVFSYIIDRGVFTDFVIVDAVETETEKWIGQMSWDELEILRREICEELGVRNYNVVLKRRFSGDSLSQSSKHQSRSTNSSSSTASIGSSRNPSSARSGSSVSTSSQSSSKSEESGSGTDTSRSDATSQYFSSTGETAI
uniref:MSC domain-containing protein n=1 Tax=Heterorhabditis bacteriophora TaxID=37862 RepID=A0A1I7WCQ1_HETBA